MNLIQAATEAEIQMARELFEEYAVGIGISLCFQNFDQELAGLPGKYALPDGRLLLAYSDDRLAGCIALRKLDSRSCEMKRLFLRNDFRGQGLGRALVQAIIDEAKASDMSACDSTRSLEEWIRRFRFTGGSDFKRSRLTTRIQLKVRCSWN